MFPWRPVRNHRHAKGTGTVGKAGARPIAVIVALATMMCSLITPATSANAADSGTSDPYVQHIVANDVNPSSVSTDLFDYWITTQNANDNTDVSDQENAGINKDHPLKFTYNGFGDSDGSYINKWTGDPTYVRTISNTSKETYKVNYGGPWSDSWKTYWKSDYPDWTKTLGIVNRTLTDGYPTLAKNNKSGKWRSNGGTPTTKGDESLAYLFDPRNTESADYKKAYRDVNGLLQLENGYYVYDSQKNFASLNTATNKITLYDTSAVTTTSGGHDQQSGQFFPFNTADQVFRVNTTSGTLSSKVNSRSTLSDGVSSLNHYFGMHSQAYFIQPNGGTVNDEPMTFDFSGDDDVWVFIDGVLVGDVSGLHDRLQLSIDFQSGKVTVSNGANYPSWILEQYKDYVFDSTTTTIRQAFADAYGEDSEEYQKFEFSGDTFADGTSHTLDFFYLERGGGNSNLKLKFNLATLPDNNLVKVDQQGNRVPGARFRLYAAKSDYSYTDSDLLSEGVTDENGSYVFKDLDTDTPLNFSSLARDGDGVTHYVLKEVSAPPGYRVSADVRLRYQEGATGNGLLLCNEEQGKWDSGAWSVPRETLTVNSGSTVYKATRYQDETPIDLDKGGRAFAVILQRDKTENGTPATDSWYAVSGSALKGWELSKESVDTLSQVADLAKSDAAGTTSYFHFFTKNSEGKYSASIDNLPGDIFTYYNMVKPDERYNALHTVAVYYTTADRTEDMNGDNTVRLASVAGSKYGDQFIRQHGVQIAVTDVRNAPIVQKVDEDGNPVEGATFGIYAESQTDKAQDGTVTLKSDAEPMQTCTTKDTDYPFPMDGSCMFGMKANGVTFDNGTYYIKEMKAPAGYETNGTLAKVLITDDGIYADAGTEDDGISTVTHVGTLNQSLYQFASNRDVNRTLSDLIVTQKRCETEQCVTDRKWETTSKSVKVTWKLKQDKEGKSVGGYWLADESNMTDNGFANTTGWTWLGVKQNLDDDLGGMGVKFSLKDSDLAHLFTGATIVRVTDKRKPSLTITKKASVAEGYEGPTKTVDGKTVSALDDQQFPFKVVLKGADENALKQDGTTFYYHGSITGGSDGTTRSVVMKLDGIAASGTGAQGELKLCTATVTSESTATDEERCATTATITLRNNETLSIANITDGVSYAVSEPTDARDAPVPEGFKQIGATGDTGTITRAGGTQKAVFSNQYGGMTTDLQASDFITVRKTVSGTAWNDDFAFRFHLESDNDAPMPGCDGITDTAVCSTGTDSATGDAVMDKVLNSTTGQSVTGTAASRDMTFGTITYSKPGTYTYRLTEYTPTAADKSLYQQYFSYSNAVYEVAVTVAVQDGKLVVTGVSVKQTRNDAGFAANGTAVDAKGNPAEFTNTFSTDPRYVSFKTHKTYTENGYAYQAGMFASTLKPVASAQTANVTLGDTVSMAGVLAATGSVTCGSDAASTSCAPMPQQSGGTSLTSVDAAFDANYAGTFPSIAFEAGNANKTYFYAISEKRHTAADSSSQGDNDPVKYDSTVYVAAVTVSTRTDTGATAGATTGTTVVDADVTYYKADCADLSELPTATLTKVTASDNGTPLNFTNSYTADSVTAQPQVRKTLTGHDWSRFSFDFTLSAADDATRQAIADGDVDCTDTAEGCLADGKSMEAKVTDGTTGSAAGTSITKAFDTLRFNRAGTYTFTIAETKGDLGYIDYDTHRATVTFTVSDLDANGKHCGELQVTTVYDNARATTESDRNATDAAAFTNGYQARLAYTGFDVQKMLLNKNAGTTRNLRAGEFTFTIEGADDESKQRISGGSLVKDREFSNAATTNATESKGQGPENQGKATDLMVGKLAGSIDTDGTEHGLVFNQTDAGKTYRFIIKELPRHTIDGSTNTTPDDVSDNPIPSGDNKGDVRIDNVWFKQTQYMAEVTVYDNGDGTMYTVTKALKKDGNDAKFRDYTQGSPTATAGVVDGETKTDRLTGWVFGFANTYEVLSPASIKASSPLYKQLIGRQWNASTTFTFTARRCNYSTETSANTLNFTIDGGTIGCTANATTLAVLPVPSSDEVSVRGGSTLVDGIYGVVTFGSFTFSKTGTYVYEVREKTVDIADIIYDSRVRYVRFVVTEDQEKGVLSVRASTPGYKTFDGAAFVNRVAVQELPFTGGTTMRGILLGGLALAAVSLISYGAYRHYAEAARRRGYEVGRSRK
ncbi:pilus assembly protein [Bifidobacterium sp. 64T4]|nr:pilus assembly protein [Bifidobacterium pongonis]MBW3093931.1 pilus assembly protein [Bifidobacterium pongonis]